MNNYRPPTDLHPAAREQIRYHATRLARCQGLGLADQLDLEQEFAAHIVAKSHLYSGSRGAPATFYSQILARKASSIVRWRASARRHRSREAIDGHVANTPAPSVDVDLPLDVEAALDRLSTPARAIAELFMGGHGQAEVSRLTGISRARVRGACAVISEHLRPVGLGYGLKSIHSAQVKTQSADCGAGS